jgi:hypothetical protein
MREILYFTCTNSEFAGGDCGNCDGGFDDSNNEPCSECGAEIIGFLTVDSFDSENPDIVDLSETNDFDLLRIQSEKGQATLKRYRDDMIQELTLVNSLISES